MMRRFQNILYVTRGIEHETDSLKQALSLARNNATTLQAVVVCPMLPRKLEAYEACYEASLANRITTSIASAQAELKEGKPEQTIPQLADRLQLDILVMGTVGRTGISGFVIGNTAENTLREVRCSLVAVKPNGFVSPVRAYCRYR